MVRKVLAGPQYASRERGVKAKSVLITAEELESLFENTRFTRLRLEVEERRSFHQSAREVMAFYEASSFGNPLSFLPEGMRYRMTRDIIDLVHKIAKLSATVLILGESGSDKLGIGFSFFFGHYLYLATQSFYMLTDCHTTVCFKQPVIYPRLRCCLLCHPCSEHCCA